MPARRGPSQWVSCQALRGRPPGAHSTHITPSMCLTSPRASVKAPRTVGAQWTPQAARGVGQQDQGRLRPQRPPGPPDQGHFPPPRALPPSWPHSLPGEEGASPGLGEAGPPSEQQPGRAWGTGRTPVRDPGFAQVPPLPQPRPPGATSSPGAGIARLEISNHELVISRSVTKCSDNTGPLAPEDRSGFFTSPTDEYVTSALKYTYLSPRTNLSPKVDRPSNV